MRKVSVWARVASRARNCAAAAAAAATAMRYDIVSLGDSITV